MCEQNTSREVIRKGIEMERRDFPKVVFYSTFPQTVCDQFAHLSELVLFYHLVFLIEVSKKRTNLLRLLRNRKPVKT